MSPLNKDSNLTIVYGVLLLLGQLTALQYRKMDFEEFGAAALSVYQLEALERWDQHARCAYELFEKDGNRPIMIEELASVSYLSSIFQSFGFLIMY